MIGYSKLVPTTKILGRQSWTVAGNPNLKAHFSVVFSYEVRTAYGLNASWKRQPTGIHHSYSVYGRMRYLMANQCLKTWSISTPYPALDYEQVDITKQPSSTI